MRSLFVPSGQQGIWPHTFIVTHQNFRELGWVVLMHPTHSPVKACENRPPTGAKVSMREYYEMASKWQQVSV